MSELELATERFGRLVAIKKAGKGNQGFLWECLCDCGTIVIVPATKLNLGRKKSCGCLAKELARVNKTTHGHKKGKKISKTYNAWTAMVDRCTNRSNSRWKDYGGRGIFLPSRWRLSFKAFLEDMGVAPVNTSLDRINNDKNYTKDNCRWATAKQQARNRRNTIFLTFQGQRKPLSEWAEIHGISHGALYQRIKRGWSVRKALGQ